MCRRLGYVQWRRFEGVVRRAQHLIQNAVESGCIQLCKTEVEIGSGAKRHVVDYELDDSAAKLVTRLASAYKLIGHFPTRNETSILRLLEQYCEAKCIRLEFQKRAFGYCFDAMLNSSVAIEFDEPHHNETGTSARRDVGKNRACQSAQIPILRFTLRHNIVDIILAVEKLIPSIQKAELFLDAGYKGLYNGLGNESIKARKGIPKSENLMDRMDATELAANQFRMTQAREKLARDRVKNQQRATRTHEQVGREVREAIRKIGGTMPENIKPAEHIKQVEQRTRQTPPKLELDDKDAKGLTGYE